MDHLKKKGLKKITTADLTKRYNVTRQTIYKWVKRGLIPPFFVERRLHGTAVRFYFKSDIEEFLDSFIFEKRLKHLKNKT